MCQSSETSPPPASKPRPPANRTSPSRCGRHLGGACMLLVLVTLVAEVSPQMLPEEDLAELETLMSQPEKRRPARLSYFRTPNNYFRGGSRPKMPWETLPDTSCLRKKCRNDRDCCRRHSKCNVQAKFCYDCWMGHPCRTNSDCCERFPYCSSSFNTCQK